MEEEEEMKTDKKEKLLKELIDLVVKRTKDYKLTMEELNEVMNELDITYRATERAIGDASENRFKN
jgi:hypothetical protein